MSSNISDWDDERSDGEDAQFSQRRAEDRTSKFAFNFSQKNEQNIIE